jgi:hypothetical protein
MEVKAPRRVFNAIDLEAVKEPDELFPTIPGDTPSFCYRFSVDVFILAAVACSIATFAIVLVCATSTCQTSEKRAGIACGVVAIFLVVILSREDMSTTITSKFLTYVVKFICSRGFRLLVGVTLVAVATAFIVIQN